MKIDGRVTFKNALPQLGDLSRILKNCDARGQSGEGGGGNKINS